MSPRLWISGKSCPWCTMPSIHPWQVVSSFIYMYVYIKYINSCVCDIRGVSYSLVDIFPSLSFLCVCLVASSLVVTDADAAAATFFVLHTLKYTHFDLIALSVKILNNVTYEEKIYWISHSIIHRIEVLVKFLSRGPLLSHWGEGKNRKIAFPPSSNQWAMNCVLPRQR